MQTRDLNGKVAVITGGASGIGLAMAMEAAQRGMKVAIADLGEDRLAQAAQQLRASGATVLTHRTDVTSHEQVSQLHEVVSAQLGDPWLVVNNAGITKIALAWQHSLADWKRMLDINVLGVVHGLDVFLPGLLARKGGHVLNTASAAGLVTIPAAAAYVASKHAVVGLSEVLYRDLEAAGTGVGVSVLCPALVRTSILGQKNDGSSAIDSPHALDPAEVGRLSLDAVERGQFWIMTHAAHMAPVMRERVEQMIAQVNPDAESIDHDAAATSTAITGVRFV